MSSGSVSPGSSNYQTAWNKALEYLDNLPPIRQKAFDLLSPSEQAVFRSTVDPAEIIQILEQSRESRHSISRLNRFNTRIVKPFLQFSPSIDTIVQMNPGIGSPIWAPIRVILQVVASTAEGFARIEAVLKTTLEKLSLFDEYEKFFRTSKPQSLNLVHDALAKFYTDVIELALVTTIFYRRSVLRSTFRSLVKALDQDFDEVISNMQGHVEAINPRVVLGGLIEARKHHEDTAIGFHALNIKADQHTADKLQEREHSVRKWLSRTNAGADQQENLGSHFSGTCDWLFQEPDFNRWRDSNHSSRLWVKGIPGCGKSVLSSVLINRLKNQGQPIVYFFCKEKDETRNNPLSILRTILWQLIDHPVHKCTFIDIIHGIMLNSGTSYADSTQKLWSPLEMIVGMLPVIYCVIDALDECDDKGGRLSDFLAKLTEVSTSTTTTTFKIFATSRLNEPHIEKQLNAAWSSIVIEKANTQNDINTFILNRIEASTTLTFHKDRVYTSVLQGADGMFLWARLMLDDLGSRSSWEIERALADMPRGLDGVYNRLLERVSESSIERCRKILHWSAIACQPLSVAEISLALAISEGLDSHEAYDSGLDQAFEAQRIRKDCGSLITTLSDETVQLVHTSLLTYLLKEHHPLKLKESVSSTFLISPDQAHASLATVCLRYNMFTCFQNGLGKLPREKIETKYPFLRYSTCNWIYHVIHSSSRDATLASIIIDFFDMKQGWLWLQRCGFFDITDGHLLVLQGDLKAWVTCKGIGLRNEGSRIGDFILCLSQREYEESERQYGEDSVGTMSAAHRLASFCDDQSQCSEALEWYERALAGYEKALGKEHPSTLATVHSMAHVYDKQGRNSEALEWYGRALAGSEKALGKEHPSTLATVHGMAHVYDKQGRNSEALEWYGRALAGREKALGKEHPFTLITFNALENLQRRMEALN